MNLHEGERILLGLKHAFDELDMDFWLIYGTCLGAVRDKKLIPYDKDIDIGIFANDIKPNFFEVMKKHVGIAYGLFLQYDFAKRLWLIRIGDPHGPKNEKLDPYVDITPFYLNDGRWWFLRGDAEEPEKLIGKSFPFEFFNTLNFVELYGEHFYIPHACVDYLEYLYGESWETPQKNVSGLRPFEEWK